jgi:hypothetical protein
MTAKKDTHENWGGRRQAGKGKRIGRPREGEGKGVMTRIDLRIPPEWTAILTTHGGGKLAKGIRKIIKESGVVG